MYILLILQAIIAIIVVSVKVRNRQGVNGLIITIHGPLSQYIFAFTLLANQIAWNCLAAIYLHIIFIRHQHPIECGRKCKLSKLLYVSNSQCKYQNLRNRRREQTKGLEEKKS